MFYLIKTIDTFLNEIVKFAFEILINFAKFCSFSSDNE